MWWFLVRMLVAVQWLQQRAAHLTPPSFRATISPPEPLAYTAIATDNGINSTTNATNESLPVFVSAQPDINFTGTISPTLPDVNAYAVAIRKMPHTPAAEMEVPWMLFVWLLLILTMMAISAAVDHAHGLRAGRQATPVHTPTTESDAEDSLVESLKQDAADLRSQLKEADEKLCANANDIAIKIEMLSDMAKRLEALNASISEDKAEVNTAKESLEQDVRRVKRSRQKYAERNRSLKMRLESAIQRICDLEAQNLVLEEQLQTSSPAMTSTATQTTTPPPVKPSAEQDDETSELATRVNLLHLSSDFCVQREQFGRIKLPIECLKAAESLSKKEGGRETTPVVVIDEEPEPSSQPVSPQQQDDEPEQKLDKAHELAKVDTAIEDVVFDKEDEAESVATANEQPQEEQEPESELSQQLVLQPQQDEEPKQDVDVGYESIIQQAPIEEQQEEQNPESELSQQLLLQPQQDAELEQEVDAAYEPAEVEAVIEEPQKEHEQELELSQQQQDAEPEQEPETAHEPANVEAAIEEAQEEDKLQSELLQQLLPQLQPDIEPEQELDAAHEPANESAAIEEPAPTSEEELWVGDKLVDSDEVEDEVPSAAGQDELHEGTSDGVEEPASIGAPEPEEQLADDQQIVPATEATTLDDEEDVNSADDIMDEDETDDSAAPGEPMNDFEAVGELNAPEAPGVEGDQPMSGLFNFPTEEELRAYMNEPTSVFNTLEASSIEGDQPMSGLFSLPTEEEQLASIFDTSAFNTLEAPDDEGDQPTSGLSNFPTEEEQLASIFDMSAFDGTLEAPAEERMDYTDDITSGPSNQYMTEQSQPSNSYFTGFSQPSRDVFMSDHDISLNMAPHPKPEAQYQPDKTPPKFHHLQQLLRRSEEAQTLRDMEQARDPTPGMEYQPFQQSPISYKWEQIDEMASLGYEPWQRDVKKASDWTPEMTTNLIQGLRNEVEDPFSMDSEISLGNAGNAAAQGGYLNESNSSVPVEEPVSVANDQQVFDDSVNMPQENGSTGEEGGEQAEEPVSVDQNPTPSLQGLIVPQAEESSDETAAQSSRKRKAWVGHVEGEGGFSSRPSPGIAIQAGAYDPGVYFQPRNHAEQAKLKRGAPAWDEFDETAEIQSSGDSADKKVRTKTDEEIEEEKRAAEEAAASKLDPAYLYPNRKPWTYGKVPENPREKASWGRDLKGWKAWLKDNPEPQG